MIRPSRLRTIEQQNDDLERGERAASSSLQETEARYLRMLERTALLEEEVEDKNALIGELQRVRDELRGTRRIPKTHPFWLFSPKQQQQDMELEVNVLRQKTAATPAPPTASAAASLAMAEPTTPVHGGSNAGVVLVEEMMSRVRVRLFGITYNIYNNDDFAIEFGGAPRVMSVAGRSGHRDPRGRGARSAQVER